MPDVDVNDIPSAQKRILLENMLHGPAFALFCEEWDRYVEMQVDAKIFALETDDATTRILKSARAHLTGTRHPMKIVEKMVRSVGGVQPNNK